MAVVGPNVLFCKRNFRVMPFYETRHIIKPGLTGWAQVNYSYGASIDDSLIKQRPVLYQTQKLLDLNIALKPLQRCYSTEDSNKVMAKVKTSNFIINYFLKADLIQNKS
jgi:lipopolysaccharide/colanic/teichoic acid biosynthesis glycosyltransferase